jgi:Beta-propeller repeat
MHMPRPGTDGRASRVAVFLLLACCSRSGLHEAGLDEAGLHETHMDAGSPGPGAVFDAGSDSPNDAGADAIEEQAGDAVPQPPPLEHTPWAQDVGGPGATVEGYAVAVDASGNVVVAGTFEGTVDFGSGPVASNDVLGAFVEKLDNDGTPLWSETFVSSGSDGGNGLGVVANGVAVDTAGDVFVVGDFVGSVDFGGGPLVSAGARDVFVAKLDPDGHYLWSERFGDAQDQTGLAIAIEPTGDLVATGGYFGTINFGGTTLTNTSSTWGAYLVHLSGSGSHVWSETFPNTGLVQLSALSVDSSGNVVAGGYFEQSVDFGGGALTAVGQDDIVVATYDPSGRYLWSKQFGASTASDYTTGIGVDPAGNIVVTGYFNLTLNLGAGPMVSTGDANIFLAKFDPSGGAMWSERFGNADCLGLGGSLAVDNLGNATMAGALYGSADFGGGTVTGSSGVSGIVYIARFDSNGHFVWSAGGAAASAGYSGASGVAADYADNVFVTGGFRAGQLDLGGKSLEPMGLEDAFLVKFAP